MRQWQQLGIASRLQNQSVAVAPREFEGKKKHGKKETTHVQNKGTATKKTYVFMYLCIYIYVFYLCVCIRVCWKGKCQEGAMNLP